ncbi:MAG TPA: TRAP transporter substrate-binding protein DctP [Thermoanaerobaculia bacterium]|nr:TRAP transporter substrate-binding protein DctP [Thermoanaerobaculia bacterium]
MTPARTVARLALLLALAASSAAAAATTIKLATLVPEGSVWDKELRSMGAAWQKRTDGRVELRLYPGGVAGDEGDVVRKMRIGQLQAATLTVIGLSELDDGFNVFAIPRFFDSYEELFHVADALRPLFAERLEKEGYTLLNWGHAGWVHLFTTQPVHVPTDLKALKLFASAGDNRMVQWWKSNGYHPVPLASTDIMTGLQTGMIQALPTTPLAALTLQWYRTTPYMLDLGLAPLVGATVVANRTWNKLSPADRAVLLAVGEQVEGRLEAAIPEQDQQAIEQMQARGLELTRPRTPEEEKAWREAAATFAASMQKAMVPQEVYQAALAARETHRRAQNGGR